VWKSHFRSLRNGKEVGDDLLYLGVPLLDDVRLAWAGLFHAQLDIRSLLAFVITVATYVETTNLYEKVFQNCRVTGCCSLTVQTLTKLSNNIGILFEEAICNGRVT
jgi:hypothetical protein